MSRPISDKSKSRMARQLRHDEVKALVASYQATGSVPATAREFRITRQTAGQHLARANIATDVRMNGELQAKAIRRYSDGPSASAVGRELGFSTHVVLKVLRDHGIEIRR